MVRGPPYTLTPQDPLHHRSGSADLLISFHLFAGSDAKRDRTWAAGFYLVSIFVVELIHGRDRIDKS